MLIARHRLAFRQGNRPVHAAPPTEARHFPYMRRSNPVSTVGTAPWFTGHIHTTVKMDCCLTPSAAHVVCGSEDGSVFFWDLLDSNIVASFAAHGAVVCGMSLHPQARNHGCIYDAVFTSIFHS